MFLMLCYVYVCKDGQTLNGVFIKTNPAESTFILHGNVLVLTGTSVAFRGI